MRPQHELTGARDLLIDLRRKGARPIRRRYFLTCPRPKTEAESQGSSTMPAMAIPDAVLRLTKHGHASTWPPGASPLAELELLRSSPGGMAATRPTRRRHDRAHAGGFPPARHAHRGSRALGSTRFPGCFHNLRVDSPGDGRMACGRRVFGRVGPHEPLESGDLLHAMARRPLLRMAGEHGIPWVVVAAGCSPRIAVALRAPAGIRTLVGGMHRVRGRGGT